MGAVSAQGWTAARKKMQASMLRFSADRRCPTCGKRAALIVDGFSAAGKIYRCRWCGVVIRPQP